MLLHKVIPGRIKSSNVTGIIVLLGQMVSKARERVFSFCFVIKEPAFRLVGGFGFLCAFSHVVFLILVNGVAAITLAGYGVAFYSRGAP